MRAVHTGISGFPFGSAAIYKCLAVYRSFVEIGIDVTIINNRAIHVRDIPYKLRKAGMVDQMEYCYTPPSPYKSSSFMMRRYSNLAGRLVEIGMLLRMRWRGELDMMVYYPQGLITNLLLYRFLSLALRVPLICHYVEFRSAFTMKKKWWHAWSDRLFDAYVTCLADAVLPISHFLEDHVRTSRCPKPCARIPPTTDFGIFQVDGKKTDLPYFLYATHAGYFEQIALVLESFAQLNCNAMQLYLIIYGNPAETSKIIEFVEEKGLSAGVKVYTRLDYSDLLSKYLHARALLIPLTASIQDRARFPYKIAEYVATGNPIITTDYGEIRHHFKDMETALIAPDFEGALIAEKMQFVVDNPEKARLIGVAAREMGYAVFHYAEYNNVLKGLIEQVIP